MDPVRRVTSSSPDDGRMATLRRLAGDSSFGGAKGFLDQGHCEVMLDDLNLVSLDNVRHARSLQTIEPFTEKRVQKILKIVAIDLYNNERLIEWYGKKARDERNCLLYFIYAVHGQAPSLSSWERASMSSDDTTSRESSPSASSRGNASTSLAGRRGHRFHTATALHKLYIHDAPTALELAYWEDLWYATVGKIRDLHDDMMTRFDNGFTPAGQVLHTRGENTKTVRKKNTDYPQDAVLGYGQDELMKQGGQLFRQNLPLRARPQGLININKMSPAMIMGMVWAKYGDELVRNTVPQKQAHSDSARARAEKRRERTNRNKNEPKHPREVQALSQDEQYQRDQNVARAHAMLEGRARFHAKFCICLADCKCRPTCEVSTRACSCNCIYDPVRLSALDEEQSEGTVYNSADYQTELQANPFVDAVSGEKAEVGLAVVPSYDNNGVPTMTKHTDHMMKPADWEYEAESGLSHNMPVRHNLATNLVAKALPSVPSKPVKDQYPLAFYNPRRNYSKPLRTLEDRAVASDITTPTRIMRKPVTNTMVPVAPYTAPDRSIAGAMSPPMTPLVKPLTQLTYPTKPTWPQRYQAPQPTIYEQLSHESYDEYDGRHVEAPAAGVDR
ncbi:hypothetical protein LTR66_014078, partial [Elasticomyces elasticus]